MARTLLTAAAIYSGDPPGPGPTAMVIDTGRITWLGPAGEVPRPVPRARVDLGAAVVLPGFIDSHQHMGVTTWLSNWVDLRGLRSPEAVVARLNQHAAGPPDGRWLVGWGYEAADAERGRRVTRWDLDGVSQDRPVLVIESSFHQGAANSPALAAVGFGRTTPPRWGGELERDRRGEPSGMAWERAFGILERAARRAEDEAIGDGWRGLLTAACGSLLAQGITHAGEALVAGPDVERFRQADLPLGFTLMPCSDRSSFATPWDALDGPRTGEGDTRAGVGPVKVFADGAERCAMSIPLGASIAETARVLSRAWRTRDPAGLRVLTSARARLSGERLVSGTLHYPPGALAGFMATALERGFTLAVHALGNEAVRVTLDAYQEARRRSGVGLAGCRIEHAMFAEPEDLARAAGLGLMLSMQPGHAVHYARTIRMAGLDRVLDPVPMRTALDQGCRVAISSDGPTAPGSALDNLRAAVERRTSDGDVMRPDLAITPSESLRAATLGGAEACGVDRMKGSLEVGKQADLAVLTGDPFDHSTRVVETWVAGARAYAAPAAAGG